MIELNPVIRNRLIATLAYLPIAPNDLKHYVARNRSRLRTHILCLCQWLAHKIDRAQMAKDIARGFCEDTRNLRGVLIGVEVNDHSHEHFSLFGRKSPAIRKTPRLDNLSQVRLMLFGALKSWGQKWKLLNEWTIRAILQFPAGLAVSS